MQYNYKYQNKNHLEIQESNVIQDKQNYMIDRRMKKKKSQLLKYSCSWLLQNFCCDFQLEMMSLKL